MELLTAKGLKKIKKKMMRLHYCTRACLN
uniref:Uncharacterized protein n=1 Tax=Arundo donax TaxID=35708 RepID=A0A0A9B911_ARUDO